MRKMQMARALLLVRLPQQRFQSLLVRCFSDKKTLDIDTLLGDFVNKEDLRRLKKKVEEMNHDTYNQAMSGQLSELGYQAERLMRQTSKAEKIPPTRSALLRGNTSAARKLRHDVYSRAISEGLTESEATILSTRAVERAALLFEEKTNKTLDEIKKEADAQRTKKTEMSDKERRLIEYASKRISLLFSHDEPSKTNYKHKLVKPDLKAPKLFGNTKKAFNFFDTEGLEPMPSSYWAAMENRKTKLINLSMGPTNAFEEQIQWTEQGRMWPYPIDNEYLIGEEENVPFTEHIFLDRYLYSKHTHLPKTGPIAHFMELVCIGLSKNPYMTLTKKHMHLDSFAEFFNPEHIEKIHKLHEEAEKQAALS